MIRRQLLPVAAALAHHFGVLPPEYGRFTWTELQAMVSALPGRSGGE